MKKLVYVLFFGLMLVVSCTKEEIPALNIDESLIKAQLMDIPTPSKQEFVAVLAEKSALKSASQSLSLVEVFPLAEETFVVTPEYAIKKFVYLEVYFDELSEAGKCVETLTMLQTFKIKDGNLDASEYKIDYVFGCKESQFFSLGIDESMFVYKVFCVFHFDNGCQFSYQAVDGNILNHKLPNIGKGKWEILVEANDGILFRRMTTGFIEDYSKPQVLYMKPQPKAINVVAQLQIERDFLKEVFYLTVWGTDPKTSEEVWMTMPFHYNEQLAPQIFFDLPFHPNKVALLFDIEQKNFELEKREEEGKIRYVLIK